LWFVVCGLWFVVCGLWFVVCGLWFAVCGLWFAVCVFKWVDTLACALSLSHVGIVFFLPTYLSFESCLNESSCQLTPLPSHRLVNPSRLNTQPIYCEPSV
jgi:hypothetical protein